MIIGITGKIGSGKSTLAQILEEKFGYTEYSMATPLKEIGRIFGFTEEQLYGTQEQKLEIHAYWKVSARTFLQKVGTELFRDGLKKVLPELKCENTVWSELFKLKYQKDPKLYVISDVRFLDEEKIIKELGGIIIKTVRNNDVCSASKSELIHSSELEMDKIKPNYVLDNNVTKIEDIPSFVAKNLGILR